MCVCVFFTISPLVLICHRYLFLDSTNSTGQLHASSAPSTIHQVITILFYSLMFLFSLSGNMMTICIVATKPYMRSVTNRLIANMAVADLLMTFSAMPYSIVLLFVKTRWFGGTLGMITCKLLHFSMALSIAASVLTLTVIALDRFFAIVFPFNRSRLMPKISTTSAIIWFLSILSMSPYLYFFKSLQRGTGNYFCYVKWEPFADTFEAGRIFFLFTFIFLYVLPLSVVAAFYGIISFKLWFRQTPGNPTASHRKNSELSKRKIIKMLIIIVIIFAVCWLPAHLMHLLQFFDYETYHEVPKFWILFAYGVSHGNSVLNPYLYIALNNNFRCAFLELIRSCFRPAGSFLRYQPSNSTLQVHLPQGSNLEHVPSFGKRGVYKFPKAETSEVSHRMHQMRLLRVTETE